MGIDYETGKVTLVMTAVEFEAVVTALQVFKHGPVILDQDNFTPERFEDTCRTIDGLNFTFANNKEEM